MSEGLNELEAALRQLQPAPVAQGPMLIEMGRATASVAARPWQWATLLTSTTAAALAAILALRPEPATLVRVVHLTAVKPAEEVRETVQEPIDPLQPPISDWRFRELEGRFALKPAADDAIDEPVTPQHALRAGDFMRDPLLRTSLIDMGGR